MSFQSSKNVEVDEKTGEFISPLGKEEFVPILQQELKVNNLPSIPEGTLGTFLEDGQTQKNVDTAFYIAYNIYNYIDTHEQQPIVEEKEEEKVIAPSFEENTETPPNEEKQEEEEEKEEKKEEEEEEPDFNNSDVGDYDNYITTTSNSLRL